MRTMLGRVVYTSTDVGFEAHPLIPKEGLAGLVGLVGLVVSDLFIALSGLAGLEDE
jgi:hypothetical protein